MRKRAYLFVVAGVVLVAVAFLLSWSNGSITGFSVLGGDGFDGPFFSFEEGSQGDGPGSLGDVGLGNFGRGNLGNSLGNASNGLFGGMSGSENRSRGSGGGGSGGRGGGGGGSGGGSGGGNSGNNPGNSGGGNIGHNNSNPGNNHSQGNPLHRNNPRFSRFIGGRNTDWSLVSNLDRVCNGEAIIDLPGRGRIRWSGCVNASGADFDRYVRISPNRIEVDSEFLHNSFNSFAILTMEGLTYQYPPIIYRNGEPCLSPFCEVLSYSGGVLEFRVSGFSAYTTGANDRLTIWDETDSGMPYAGKIRRPGEQTLIFANFTSLAGPLVGASCIVNFSDSGASMTYNATSGLYQYSRTFSGIGAYPFNVTCSLGGYETLFATDEVFIWGNFSTTSFGPFGATVNAGASSRAIADNPSNHSAYSGNVTELLITGSTITQSWQGYFGNVSGTIFLADSFDNVLYNWSVASPEGEVYASRNPSVNFNGIGCANATQISSEELLMGQTASDVDSMSATFSANNHPLFYIGSTQINANQCKSTNIFEDGGQNASTFYEVLLSDNVSIVYTSLLEEDLLGFNARTHDFEMIVAEDGHGADIYTTPYFFYVEIQ